MSTYQPVDQKRWSYIYMGVTELDQPILTYNGNNINVTHRMDFKLVLENVNSSSGGHDNYLPIPPYLQSFYPENYCQ